jgi:CDP-paratose 2-epimerase
MKKGVVLVTGSGGLIGSAAVEFFIKENYNVVGIDNDMRSYFFGKEASTKWNTKRLYDDYPNDFTHFSVDIRNYERLEEVFKEFKSNIKCIIHTAAQPSHDWAAKEPLVDFGVNATGTMNLLELSRNYCKDSVFIFTSTNKVYGDTPNKLPLVELENRYEIDDEHKFYKNGIDESMSIDNSKHSIFGASKVAADVMVQEYGKYFNMPTGVFRGGCLTGGNHSGAELHGFLAYLGKCVATGKEYTVFGRKGKTVRDNIHANDVISAFNEFFKDPDCGEVYNIGGGRHSNCSMLEAIKEFEDLSGKKANVKFVDEARIGDHIWYISDMTKFKNRYPKWNYKYNINDISKEIIKNINH